MAYHRLSVPETAKEDLGGYMHNLASQFSSAGNATVSFKLDGHCADTVLCANVRGKMSQSQQDMISARAYQPSV